MIQQWNFSVQQQLFSDWIVTVAYAGSNGNHLFLTNQLNPTVYGRVAANTNLERVYAPNYSSIVDIISVGQSNYNALQVSANKRFHHGLTILLNYTFSKSIDEGSNDSNAPANPYNIRAERAVSDFNLPNKFVASFVWDLPGAAIHNRLARAIVGGWELNGIINLQSGLPFSVTSGVNNSGSGIGSDRANLVGDPNPPGGQSTAQMLHEYFNTSAFVVNTPGTFGNTGRNILIGPNMKDLDAGLFRNFPIRERYKIQFRAESFNLFNHPNFNNPNASVSASTFGTITAVIFAARHAISAEGDILAASLNLANHREMMGVRLRRFIHGERQLLILRIQLAGFLGVLESRRQPVICGVVRFGCGDLILKPLQQRIVIKDIHLSP